MEGRFEWQKEYEIGVAAIDKEHQQLFRIINRLFDLKEQERDSEWACAEGLKFFKAHAGKHFADEEEYMASINYEGLARHQRIHQGFRETTLPALEQELAQTGYAPDAIDHFLGVCAGWLIGHTLTEDQAITGRHEGQWKDLLPSEEITAIKKAVIQLIFDMFHLESSLLSDAYSGERFGRGIYYRLVYSAAGEQEQQEIFMVFEEQLLINTVGRIIGIQTNKLDTMLLHASRYTARQFVEQLLKCLPTNKSYELKEESLLSYSEFQQVFAKKKMQVSLLFNTGGGYFAYCAIAPGLMKGKAGTPIGAKNALSEVEKYLSERERQEAKAEADTRPKVLLVDDSAAACQAMKGLLEKDYQVALAESGVAAIRSVTLDRPDLVLMDYEMPVCDGRQTLEMLRSEPAFSDLPVFFMTGRSDPQSMIKVMPLRPEGYLLKTMKPEELKKRVEEFFAKRRAAAGEKP